jgi:hypothetical protein
MDLKVSAISFDNISSASTYGAQQTAARPPRPVNEGKDPTNNPAESGAPLSSVVGNQDKLSQLSTLYDIDAEKLKSASSTKELVDMLQLNGVDLSKLKTVLNSGDILNATA